jgi:hypothetical protein
VLYRSYTVGYYKRALGDFVVSVQCLAIEMMLVQRSGSVLLLLGENLFCFRRLGGEEAGANAKPFQLIFPFLHKFIVTS